MLRYRLFAAVAAGLIALAGVLTVTAGGTPPVPPPVALRGTTPDADRVLTEGLEFVPPTVAEMVPVEGTPDTTSEANAPATDSVASAQEATADSPDAEESPEVADSPDEADSPEATDSPDDVESSDQVEQQSESEDVASADSPDEVESVEYPDSIDSPDSVDSADD